MKFKGLAAPLFSLLLLASCAHFPSGSTIEKVTHFTMPNPAPIAGVTVSGQNIYLGGFSGLSFVEAKDGAFFFNAITDRGPNGWNEGLDRPFLLPEFSPQIVTLKADPSKKTLEVVNKLELKKKNGQPLSGRPNHRGEENPTDLYGYMYSVDPMGLDTEALVRDTEGGFWVGEEYAPSLVHFNGLGLMTRRLTPGNELPKIYLERKTNRGFEGVALIENRLFGFLQSPLPKEDGLSRIVEVDLESMKTSAEYFYPFEKGNDKIGDAVALGKNTLLVIEQNGKTGDKGSKLIFKITLNGSDKNVEKTLIADLKDTPFNNVEKVEGLALINNHQLALIYDNDFQISGKTDPKTGITPLNNDANQMIILDLKEELK
ncbi:MAG: esterase-like activity of phytase family protein [Bacteriovorax sp.]